MKTLRILSYNILKGGVGREAPLAAVISSCKPDIVVLQEAYNSAVVRQLAATCGFDSWASSQGHSVAFLSRLTIAGHVWRRVRWAKRAYLEIVTAADFRIYGVHLSAVHSNLTEQRRAYELRALLRSVERQRLLLSLLDSDPDLPRLASAFLRPPLRSTEYGRAFGTLYTAVYRPTDGVVDYLWPDDSWRRSFDSIDATKTVILKES